MEICYWDKDIVVCLKPPGVLSTDEPGGMPELVRAALGDPNVRTVHRLDRVVGGLMLLARRAKAASVLSRQMREGQFHKEYQAVIHGHPEEKSGIMRDWLHRDKQERKSYLAEEGGAETQEAILRYRVLAETQELSRVAVELVTGRTHQIRAQFAGHGMPLVGDRKYGRAEPCPIALWSAKLAFFHPYSGEPMTFSQDPPEICPWTDIKIL